jgi:hypothetical protein
MSIGLGQSDGRHWISTDFTSEQIRRRDRSLGHGLGEPGLFGVVGRNLNGEVVAAG